MKTPYIILSLMLVSTTITAKAQDISQCEPALAPTEERAKSDYSIMQSYMSLNASLEYDKLQKMSSKERGASASYKYFGAEYNDSKNASEFQEKVRNRLNREGFSLQEFESRANYRRYLSEAQLSAWSSCVMALSGAGAVIITAESVSESAFPIKVNWYPPIGVGSGQLFIEVENASIRGTNKIKERLVGQSTKPFIIKPDNSTHQIVLTAEIGGMSDVLALPRKFPVEENPPTIKLYRTKEEYAGNLGGYDGANSKCKEASNSEFAYMCRPQDLFEYDVHKASLSKVLGTMQGWIASDMYGNCNGYSTTDTPAYLGTIWYEVGVMQGGCDGTPTRPIICCVR